MRRAADPPSHNGGEADPSGLRAAATELVVYRHRRDPGEAGENVLAYVVEVTNRSNIRDMVFVDANTGKLLNRYSMIDDALERELYEAVHARPTLVWEEGDPFPGDLNVDQQSLVLGAGETYWLFQNAFGRDSYDGAGAR